MCKTVQNIPVQGFYPLKIKITQFPDLFRLKPFAFWRLQNQGFVENDEVLRAN